MATQTQSQFTQQLKKYYSVYTGGFIAFVILLAIAEQMGLTPKYIGYPRLVEIAAKGHEPHRVAFYLHEVAAAFHGLWAKGNADASLRFVNDADRTLTLARLTLVAAVRQVLVNGLAILGVSAPEELS